MNLDEWNEVFMYLTPFGLYQLGEVKQFRSIVNKAVIQESRLENYNMGQNMLTVAVLFANNMINFSNPLKIDFLIVKSRMFSKALKPECKGCGVATTKKCSNCKNTYYCSVACQRSHYPQHKAICVKPKIDQWPKYGITRAEIGDGIAIGGLEVHDKMPMDSDRIYLLVLGNGLGSPVEICNHIYRVTHNMVDHSSDCHDCIMPELCRTTHRGKCWGFMITEPVIFSIIYQSIGEFEIVKDRPKGFPFWGDNCYTLIDSTATYITNWTRLSHRSKFPREIRARIFTWLCIANQLYLPYDIAIAVCPWIATRNYV